jgi:formylglycine-generating enzyme required for sulfatase activity/curved DNA-binding protein CbpA
MTGPHQDLYELLQVSPTAGMSVIQAAWRRLAVECHPDKNPRRQRWAEEQTKQLNIAYGILSDPEQRAEYDALRPSAHTASARGDIDRLIQEAERRREQADRARQSAEQRYRSSEEELHRERRLREQAERELEAASKRAADEERLRWEAESARRSEEEKRFAAEGQAADEGGLHHAETSAPHPGDAAPSDELPNQEDSIPTDQYAHAESTVSDEVSTDATDPKGVQVVSGEKDDGPVSSDPLDPDVETPSERGRGEESDVSRQRAAHATAESGRATEGDRPATIKVDRLRARRWAPWVALSMVLACATGIYLLPRAPSVDATPLVANSEGSTKQRPIPVGKAERLLDELDRSTVTHTRRRDIGVLLDRIGDPRPGVGVENGVPDIDWVHVSPGGSVDLGRTRKSVSRFYLSKYPVTYAQYEAFVEAADGFDNPKWWRGMPSLHTPPTDDLAAQRNTLGNAPRDNVSWYQAVAFTRWLTAELNSHNGGAASGGSRVNGSTWEVRLPTEWEWQWAAQGGSAKREYPWGSWQAGHANAAHVLDSTTAVGMYPQGASVSGVLDLPGNVWEWCLSKDRTPYSTALDARNAPRALRGGSFTTDDRMGALSYRASHHPYLASRGRGFRVGLFPPGSGSLSVDGNPRVANSGDGAEQLPITLGKAERLLQELDRSTVTDARRRDIGVLLDKIGDPRTGVGVENGVPDIDWVHVSPGGSVNLGRTRKSVSPFYLSKYPVTYAQYEAFVKAADGFDNPRWWRGMPSNYTPPTDDLDAQRNPLRNAPRDNVSWYQAVAFTRWLTAKPRSHNWSFTSGGSRVNGPIWEARLPTEWEWQWAAQGGSAKREYPWGSWKAGHANAAHVLDSTTAVGMYPQGASASGVLGLSGNVWEWCLSMYRAPYSTTIGATPAARVLRGGSFNHSGNAASSRATHDDPYFVWHAGGFRVGLFPPM